MNLNTGQTIGNLSSIINTNKNRRSNKLKTKVKQILYLLCQFNKIIKTLYSNLIKLL